MTPNQSAALLVVLGTPGWALLCWGVSKIPGLPSAFTIGAAIIGGCILLLAAGIVAFVPNPSSIIPYALRGAFWGPLAGVAVFATWVVVGAFKVAAPDSADSVAASASEVVATAPAIVPEPPTDMTNPAHRARSIPIERIGFRLDGIRELKKQIPDTLTRLEERYQTILAWAQDEKHVGWEDVDVKGEWAGYHKGMEDSLKQLREGARGLEIPLSEDGILQFDDREPVTEEDLVRPATGRISTIKKQQLRSSVYYHNKFVTQIERLQRELNIEEEVLRMRSQGLRRVNVRQEP